MSRGLQAVFWVGGGFRAFFSRQPSGEAWQRAPQCAQPTSQEQGSGRPRRIATVPLAAGRQASVLDRSGLRAYGLGAFIFRVYWDNGTENGNYRDYTGSYRD